jgi:predicted O-methyltransferase YrrM
VSMLRVPNEAQLLQVPGWLTAEEGRRLAYLASQVPRSQAIVEIGSFAGRSTSFLASGSRYGNGAPVFAVDVWKHGGGWALEIFEQQLEALQLRNAVQPLPGRSSEVSRWWQMPIGLLFIDGEHDWQNVAADFENWVPHLTATGWLAVHDYHPTYPDVKRFMDLHVVGSPLWRYQSVVGVSLLSAMVTPPEMELATNIGTALEAGG